MKEQLRVQDPAIARLISSPIRLEILGQFSTPDALSVREIAQRMGRPPAALHYHVRLLHDAGLLEESGRRRRGRRHESLYRPVARRFEVPADAKSPQSLTSAKRTMRAALRMAERDLEKALGDANTRSDGAQRNLLGMRLHARMRSEDLEELNRRLRAVEEFLSDLCRRPEIPDDADVFCSLTILLAPMHDRQP